MRVIPTFLFYGTLTIALTQPPAPEKYKIGHSYRSIAGLSFSQSKRPKEVHLLPAGNGGGVYCSNIKPVIRLVTIQTDLFATHDANPIGPGLLAAAFADVGIEQLYLHNPGRGIN